MTPQNCWRCLLRPSLANSAPATRAIVAAPPSAATVAATAHSFSTTASPRAGGKHIRTGKKMVMAKFKKQIVHGRRPAHGERKAWRKRIVLTNNNALPVDDLKPMDWTSLADPACAGTVMSIPTQVIDKLRRVEAFKTSQTWNLFRSPHSLVRRETVHVCDRMNDAANEKRTAQIVLSGPRGTGKSIVLLQTMVHAFLNDWIVIYIPEARELTTAVTEYAPIPDTKPQLWMQSAYALALLHKIRDANRHVLSKLYTTRSYEQFTNPVVLGASLTTLIDSAREAEQAWPVFAALWHELFAAKTPRQPVLLALDGLGHTMTMSKYLDTQARPIHSHDLGIIRMFLDVLSGATRLPNGGAVVAADSQSNVPRNASLELAIQQHLARQMEDVEVPEPDPWCRTYDPRVDAVLAEDKGIEVVGVEPVTKPEARSLMEYWAASGLLRSRVDEKSVTEKWMTGGGGVIAEMERAGLLTLRL